jgi:hypothetical protein
MSTGKLNPLASSSDVAGIVRRLAEMIPSGPEVTESERPVFAKERAEAEARYREARYGRLPPNTYRVLEQGGFVGWRYELEIGAETVTLKEPEGDAASAISAAW